MVKVLELFSGTGSIGKIAKERKWDVVSLDLENKFNPDIITDINKWDYKNSKYEVGHFDIITASPVCLWWSKLRNCHIGRNGITKKSIDYDINTKGKPMVDKVLEIIEYFQPKYYWIENPQTGRMKEYITKMSFYDVDYCKYANWGYKKRTRLWTNIKGFTPKVCKKDCNSIVGNRHIKSMGNGYVKLADGTTTLVNTKEKRKEYKDKKIVFTESPQTTTKHERYRIPPQLIEDLFDATTL